MNLLFMRNDLQEEYLEQLKPVGLQKKFKKRTNIINQGQISHKLYLILEGYVKLILISDDGQAHIIGFCGKGTWINDFSYFYKGFESIFAVEAADEVICLEFDFSKLDDISEKYEVLYSIEKGLVGKCTLAEEKIKIISFYDTTQCIVWVLAGLMDNFGIPKKEGILIDFSITIRDLAQLSGSSVGAVNLFIKKFTKEGIIARDKGHLLIKNPSYLLSLI